MKRVRSAGAHREKLLLFIGALIIPLILYGSPVTFPALQKQDFVVLRRLQSIFNLQMRLLKATLAYNLSRLQNNSAKNVNSTEKVAE